MTRGGVRCLAGAASSALQDLLAGPARRADWLGVSPSALYLAVSGGPEVIAVLTHEAVRLPPGLVLASTAAELPLTGLVPRPDRRCTSRAEISCCSGDSKSPHVDTSCTVGGGQVRWSSPAGTVVISAVRQWVPATVTPAPVAAGVIGKLGPLLDRAAAGLEPGQVAGLREPGREPAAVSALIGRGPGLTPSGDDVLAGFLIGARAFGLRAAAVAASVAALAPASTTALSARLLWHAARAECVPQVAALAAAMQGRGTIRPAVCSLLAVGHSSGAALGLGLLLAAERAAAHLDAAA